MAKALTLVVFINMWNFIRNFLKFWTHCVQSLGVPCHGRIYRILLQETSPEARAWYAKEAQEQLEEEIKDVRDQNSKLQIQVNKSSVEAVDEAQKKQKEAEKKMEQAEAKARNEKKSAELEIRKAKKSKGKNWIHMPRRIQNGNSCFREFEHCLLGKNRDSPLALKGRGIQICILVIHSSKLSYLAA